MNWQEYIQIKEKCENLDDITGIVSTPLTDAIEQDLMFWERLMEYTVHTGSCLGMAGIQLGMPYRGFYLAINKLGEFRFRNPIVKATSPDKIMFKSEGCMSLPGAFIDTLRYSWVDVYDDINGLKRYTGLLGTCIQHEMDHLDGNSFFEHAVPANYKRVKTGRNDPCPECTAMGKENPPKFKKCRLHYR